MQITSDPYKTVSPFFRYFFDIKNVFFFLLFFIIVFPKIPLVSTSFATSIRLEDFIIVYLWILLGIYILNGKVRIYKSKFFFWISLYLFLGLISTTLGYLRGDVTTPLFFLRKVEYVSLSFFAYIIINKKNISKFYNLLFVSFGFVALIGFLQYFKVLYSLGIAQKLIPILQPASKRFWMSSTNLVSSTFAGNYELGACLLLIVPFLLLLTLNPRYPNRKMAFLGFLSLFIIIWLSGARTPTVIISGVVFIIFMKRLFSGKKNQIFKSFVVLIILISILVPIYKIISKNFLERTTDITGFRYKEIVKFVQTDRSMNKRLQKWSIVWNSFLTHPLLGIGVGGFSDHFIAADGQDIQTLGETGLVGFSLLLIVFFYVIKINNQTKQYLKRIISDKARELDKGLLTALSIGILGLIINGITINVLDASKVAMYLWTLIGVAMKLNFLYKHTKNAKSKNIKLRHCND